MAKIKEYDIDDEDELLEAIMIDEDWDKGWKLIDPNRVTIKDIFKYEKNVSIEIRLDCEHAVEGYLDFGDGSPITRIDEFSVTKKDGLSIFKTRISHLYSKKKKIYRHTKDKNDMSSRCIYNRKSIYWIKRFGPY